MDWVNKMNVKNANQVLRNLKRMRIFVIIYIFSLFLCVHCQSVMFDSFIPVDCRLPGSSVHEILQARILEWVAISFSRESSQPKDRTWVSCVREAHKDLSIYYIYMPICMYNVYACVYRWLRQIEKIRRDDV